jgi:hypothetical protein
MTLYPSPLMVKNTIGITIPDVHAEQTFSHGYQYTLNYQKP